MDKKIMQRVIGAFVLIALVIIMLPLFFSKSEKPTTELAASDTPPPPITTQPKETDIANPVQPSDAQKTAQSTDTTKASTTELVQQTTDATKAGTAESVQQTTANNQTNTANSIETSAPTALQEKTGTAQPTKQESTSNEGTPLVDKATLAKSIDIMTEPPKKIRKELRQTAWVVQMGSFKNKENARHLTDRLRVAGFKAFTQVIKNGEKERYHVYVGPEFKRTAASQLSTKVTKRMKMQGIIVTYKPLAV